MWEKKTGFYARTRLVFGSVIIVLMLLLIPSMLSDSSDAAVCDDIRVFIENESGEYDKSTVSGVGTVKAAIEAAIENQNKTITYNDRGNVASVNGRTLDSNHYWRVHQWLPLGTSGWGVMGFDSESDKMMKSGASYCLHTCTATNNDGTIVYSVPDFKPQSKGYVFIRFANGYDANNIDVQNTFTSEIRTKGFWLEGTGSSMGEVLKDAVESNNLDIVLKTGVDSNGNDLQCWIIRMFGIGDVLVETGVWAYWSQWTWVDGKWDYNNWTLGYYDPAVYRYVECIYLISTPDPYGDGYLIDKGGPEPNPYVDTINCIKNYNTVSFVVDGEVVKETEVKYGQVCPESQIPKVETVQGRTFIGWGNVNKAITEDTVFTAQFDTSRLTVRYYYDETKKILLHTEQVDWGTAAKYSVVPTKAETDEYTFRFLGWSSDLSCVKADMDVTPIFESVQKSHTHSWRTESSVVASCTSAGRTIYVCDACGERKTETTPALGHSWDSGTVKQPACTESGTKTLKCTRCSENKVETIAALGHSWSEWSITKEPTLKSLGEKKHTCGVCKVSETLSTLYVNTDGDMEISRDGTSTTIKQSEDVPPESVTFVRTDVTVKDGIADVVVDSFAVSEALKQIKEASDVIGAMSSTVIISTGDEKSDSVIYALESDSLAILATDVLKVTFQSSFGMATVGKDVLSDMSKMGDRASIKIVSGDMGLENKFISHVIAGHSISVEMLSGDTEIHELSGDVTLTFGYELPEGKVAEAVSVWYVDGDSLQKIENSSYDSEKGEVTFTTNHFSSWIIGIENITDQAGDNTILYVGIGVALSVCIVGLFLILRKRQ